MSLDPELTAQLKRVLGALEAVEEKMSLSGRFGLWVAFHPFGQDLYLDVARRWIEKLCRKAGAPLDWTREAEAAAILWSQRKGDRSGGSPTSSRATGSAGPSWRGAGDCAVGKKSIGIAKWISPGARSLAGRGGEGDVFNRRGPLCATRGTLPGPRRPVYPVIGIKTADRWNHVVSAGFQDRPSQTRGSLP